MVIVGYGPEHLRLQTKYPDIVFAGMQKGEDLARYYASSDIFLFPSVTETFGNVVAEALSSGLAVVSYDYAAGRELGACHTGIKRSLEIVKNRDRTMYANSV